MTSRLRFRNLEITPSSPVDSWPEEALQTALERGSISDYRRLAAHIDADPWGRVALSIEEIIARQDLYGTGSLFRAVIARARQQQQSRAAAEVARRLRELVAAAGLSQAEFASRLGTSPSRLSTYLRGTVTPSAAFLIRAQDLAARATATALATP